MWDGVLSSGVICFHFGGPKSTVQYTTLQYITVQKTQQTNKQKTQLKMSLIDFMITSHMKLQTAGHVQGPQCRCTWTWRTNRLWDWEHMRVRDWMTGMGKSQNAGGNSSCPLCGETCCANTCGKCVDWFPPPAHSKHHMIVEHGYGIKCLTLKMFNLGQT